MNAPATIRMTVEQFQDWLDARNASLPYDEPKWELFDGVPEMQQSQRKIHARVKYRIMRAVERAIESAGLPLEADIDGLSVRVGPNALYVPEVVVYPAGTVVDDDLVAADPVIVVEVLSPSSLHKDLKIKAAGYGRVPTIAHYLVVDPDAREIFHFRRDGDVLAEPSAPIKEGVLDLVPPGITLDIAKCFAA